MNEAEKSVNKDLILRERLAIDRTDMAIDRTLLSFIRTSLYFAVAGMTVNSLLDLSYGAGLEVLFWILSIVVLAIGILKCRQQKRKLKASEKLVGNYKHEWEDDIE